MKALLTLAALALVLVACDDGPTKHSRPPECVCVFYTMGGMQGHKCYEDATAHETVKGWLLVMHGDGATASYPPGQWDEWSSMPCWQIDELVNGTTLGNAMRVVVCPPAGSDLPCLWSAPGLATIEAPPPDGRNPGPGIIVEPPVGSGFPAPRDTLGRKKQAPKEGQ